MQLFWILLIPATIALVATFLLKFNINFRELVIQLAGGTLIICIMWFAGSYMSTKDTEIINGQIIEKTAWKFSCPTNTSNPCRNSYSCNCYQICTSSTDSKGNITQSCTTHCDTCYEYPWEQNWYVKSNVQIGQSIVEINRVDKQGAREPSRWTAVKIGDPYATTHSYDNWVKASSNSLFKSEAYESERYKKILPQKQNISIVDYYNVDRIITPNVKLANEPHWNELLSQVNGSLGNSKQVDIWLVFVEADRSYAKALQRQWHGFKKNQAIIFVGAQKGKVSWVDVISWSKQSIYDVELRNHLNIFKGQNLNDIDPVIFMNYVSVDTQKNFVRRSMKEFEYLRGEIVPPTWLLISCIIAGILWGVVTSYVFHRSEF